MNFIISFLFCFLSIIFYFDLFVRFFLDLILISFIFLADSETSQKKTSTDSTTTSHKSAGSKDPSATTAQSTINSTTSESISQQQTNAATTTASGQQQQQQQQSRLNKYYSRMPIRSSLKSFTKFGSSSKSDTKAQPLIPPQLSTNNNNNTTSSLHPSSCENNNKSTGMSLGVRREDSAYSSSTSSTGSERVTGPEVTTGPGIDSAKFQHNQAALKTASSVDEKSSSAAVASRIDEMAENLDQISLNSVDFSSSTSHRRSVKAQHHQQKRNSIRDSVGELNQLMLISSGVSIGSGSAGATSTVTAQNDEQVSLEF